MTFALAVEDDRGPDPGTFRAEFASLCEELDAEIRRLGPVCDLSGRCCRFRDYDHTLFLSAPEAALLVADAPPPSRPLDDGATCPWQDRDGRCTARSARPLGCRLYYCDPAYRDQGPRLAEEFTRRLKSLVDRLGLPWDYAPLHRHLREAVEAGRLVTPSVVEADQALGLEHT
jgi:Fe-S-cluster containining protein